MKVLQKNDLITRPCAKCFNKNVRTQARSEKQINQIIKVFYVSNDPSATMIEIVFYHNFLQYFCYHNHGLIKHCKFLYIL